MLSTGCAGSDAVQAAGTGVLMPAGGQHSDSSSSKHTLPPRHSGMQAARRFAMPTAPQHCLQQAAGTPPQHLDGIQHRLQLLLQHVARIRHLQGTRRSAALVCSEAAAWLAGMQLKRSTGLITAGGASRRRCACGPDCVGLPSVVSGAGHSPAGGPQCRWSSWRRAPPAAARALQRPPAQPPRAHPAAQVWQLSTGH